MFWRYSAGDAVYAVPGFVAIPPVKSSSHYVGTAVDLNMEWSLQRHVALGTSYGTSLPAALPDKLAVRTSTMFQQL